MPYWELGQWTALVGDETLFSQRFGTFVTENQRNRCVLIRPTIPRWKDLCSTFDPWRIAELLIEQYPQLTRKDIFVRPQPIISEHRQKYINWLTELVALLAVHPSGLPAISPQPADEFVWIHYLNDDMNTPMRSVTTFIAPPPGLIDTVYADADTAKYAVALPRDPDAPSLVWPTNRKADSTLDDWYESNGPGEPKELP